MTSRVLVAALGCLLVVCIAGGLFWNVKSDKSGLEVIAQYAKHGIELRGKYSDGEVVFSTVSWSRDRDHESTRPSIILANNQPSTSLDDLDEDSTRSWASVNYTESDVDGTTDCIGFVPRGKSDAAYVRLWWVNRRLNAIYVSEMLPKTPDGKTDGSIEILSIGQGTIQLPMRKTDADRLLGLPVKVEEIRLFP